MKVLVIDDDPSVAYTLSATLKKWNHQIETSDTGEEALAKLRKKEFDLVLLDLFLPDAKGYELIPRFKELWPEIKIITITGCNSRELEWETRQHGILYYMIKPVSIGNLKSIMDHISKKNGEEVNENDRKAS